MSAHDITAAAIRHWQQSLTAEPYASYIAICKAKGLFWLAADTIEEATV